MVITWGGNRSAWDFTNPKNWVINKSLEQNLNEFSTGMQVMGLVIPEAVANRVMASGYTGAADLATKAATAAGGASGVGAATGGTAAAAGALGPSLIDLATKGAQVGFDVYLLEWLKNNWWIPAILVGGYLGIKLLK